MQIITHIDADGVLSAALALKKLGRAQVNFSTPVMLRSTIAETLKHSDLKSLYVFDIAPNAVSVRIASVYNRVVWIDHHLNEVSEFPDNFDVLIKESPSAARLVSEYFGTDSSLAAVADEIDTNNVKSEKAAWLRDYIAYLRSKFKGVYLAKALRNLTFSLAQKSLEELMKNDVLSSMVESYRKWLEEEKQKLKESVKTLEVGDKKIAVLHGKELPPYVVVEELKSHEQAPFDVIVLSFYRNGFTHFEFRTHTGFEVVNLARSLGGGGHRVAAGATIEGQVDTLQEIMKVMQF